MLNLSNGSAQCAIRQMRQEMENFQWCLDEMTALIDNPGYAALQGTNASGIAYMTEALTDARKYFNKAFRRMIRDAEDLSQDAARNVPVEQESDILEKIARGSA